MSGDLPGNHLLVDLPLDRVAQQVSALVGEPTHGVRELVSLHVGALAAALALDAPELLADHRRWESVRLGAMHEPVDRARLDESVRLVLAEHVEADAQDALDSVYAAAARVRDAGPDDERVLPEMAQEYLGAALQGPPERALRVVQDAVAVGTPVAEIMVGILQPAQEELGRRWEEGALSISEEHRITATTQLALAALYPQVAAGADREADPPTMVAAAVGSEGHDLGIRMISDLMESEGWRTAYLGASVPAPDLVRFLRHRRPDVLAVSTTLAVHLLDVRALVAAVREDPVTSRVRVLVGGRPFSRHPRLAALVGADGTARTAEETLLQCRAWVG
jgi:methanogenic corrinoid protein MtbC1